MNPIEIYIENIINNIPHCVFWKDTNHVFRGCNRKFAEQVGFTCPEEVIGKTDFEMPWGRQYAEKYIADDKKIITSGLSKLNYEEKQIAPDGSERVVSVSKVPILAKTGEVIAVLGIYTDITERIAQDKSLNEMLDQVKALNRAKSDFISNMSHDVKTPLSGIIGMAEVLSHQMPVSQIHEYARSIRMAGQQLMHFFDNCISIAQSESAHCVLTSEYFNIRTMLSQLYELFHPCTSTRNLAFSINCDRAIPDLLLGCAAGIYRILLNLIGNAVKFTHHGKINVRVLAGEKSSESKVILKIIVEDTGIGVPADKQKIIFDHFTRLAPSWQGLYEGNGIGLYVVNQFIKAMGGEIHLWSESGIGSRFVVILPISVPLLTSDEYVSEELAVAGPCDEKPFEITQNPQPKSAHHKPLEMKCHSYRILLVEDNALAQKVATSMLNTLQCEVDIAESGRRALMLFEPRKYDLILMDVGLPDLSGSTVAELIRQLEIKQSSLLRVPIIALTAHMNDSLLKECREAGMDDVLQKPLSLEISKKIISSLATKTDKDVACNDT